MVYVMELDFDRSLFFLRVSLELIRIFGSIQHIRQVLESLLHRLLISALPEDRCETLKSLNSVSLLFNFLFLILSPPPYTYHHWCILEGDGGPFLRLDGRTILKKNALSHYGSLRADLNLE